MGLLDRISSTIVLFSSATYMSYRVPDSFLTAVAHSLFNRLGPALAPREDVLRTAFSLFSTFTFSVTHSVLGNILSTVYRFLKSVESDNPYDRVLLSWFQTVGIHFDAVKFDTTFARKDLDAYFFFPLHFTIVSASVPGGYRYDLSYSRYGVSLNDPLYKEVRERVKSLYLSD